MIGISLGGEIELNRALKATEKKREEKAEIAEKRRLEILAEKSDPKYQLRLQRESAGLNPDKDFETFEEYLNRRWTEMSDFMRMYYQNGIKKQGYDHVKKDFANGIRGEYVRLYGRHPDYKEPKKIN